MPSKKPNVQAKPKPKETKYSSITNDIPSGKGINMDEKWKAGDHTEEITTEADNLQNSNETKDLFREEKDEPPPVEKLSPLRRLALLASLLFCVFVIFTFAFLLPCHETKCKANWALPLNWTHNINISGIKPIFIEVLGIKREPSKDIVLGYNKLCQDRPGKACSGGLIAFRGPDGKRLWNLSLPTSGSVTSMVCRQPRNKAGQPLCIVSGNKSELYRVGIHNGNLTWMRILSGEIMDFDIVSGFHGYSSSGVVALQSLASGKFRRSLSDQGSERLTLMSGKSGHVIGSAIPLLQNEISSSFLVTTHGLADQTEFVLFESHSANHLTGSLWAISTSDLYNITQNIWNASSAMKWGTLSPDPVTGFIQVLPDSIITLKPVLQDLNLDGIKDIVICRRNMKSEGVQVIALDGVNLQFLWKTFLPASTVDKELVPSLFDSDEIPDIAVQLNYGNLTSLFVILSGANGSIVWTLSSSRVLPISPAGVAPIISSSGGYLLWLPKPDLEILKESTLNAANSSVEQENRKRREAQLQQDFDFKILSSLQRKSDEGRSSQDVFDDISQTVKDSKLHYKDALEDAPLGEQPQKDIKRQENDFDYTGQVEEPISRGVQFSSLHKQMKKDLTNELEELPGSSDGRHKRVAPQKEPRKQFLRAHKKLSRCGGMKLNATDVLVAVFVHKPKGAQVELVKVVEQPSLYLGVKKYRSLFSTSPPWPSTCVKFTAHILQRPVLDDLNGNKEIQLVYVVSYLEELPPSAHVQTRKRIVHLKMVQV